MSYLTISKAMKIDANYLPAKQIIRGRYLMSLLLRLSSGGHLIAF